MAAFESLPHELLQRVLEHISSPSSKIFEDLKANRYLEPAIQAHNRAVDALTALSLVSHTFREITLPVLHGSLLVEHGYYEQRHLLWLPKKFPPQNHRGHIRHVAVRMARDEDTMDPAVFLPFLGIGEGLRYLYLDRERRSLVALVETLCKVVPNLETLCVFPPNTAAIEPPVDEHGLKAVRPNLPLEKLLYIASSASRLRALNRKYDILATVRGLSVDHLSSRTPGSEIDYERKEHRLSHLVINRRQDSPVSPSPLRTLPENLTSLRLVASMFGRHSLGVIAALPRLRELELRSVATRHLQALPASLTRLIFDVENVHQAIDGLHTVQQQVEQKEIGLQLVCIRLMEGHHSQRLRKWRQYGTMIDRTTLPFTADSFATGAQALRDGIDTFVANVAGVQVDVTELIDCLKECEDQWPYVRGTRNDAGKLIVPGHPDEEAFVDLRLNNCARGMRSSPLQCSFPERKEKYTTNEILQDAAGNPSWTDAILQRFREVKRESLDALWPR